MSTVKSQGIRVKSPESRVKIQEPTVKSKKLKILTQADYDWLSRILADPGWLWLTLADSGRLLPILDDSRWLWLWQTLADYADFRWLLLPLADSGRFRLTLADSGCVWLNLADTGQPSHVYLNPSHVFFWQFNMSISAISCLSRGHLMSWSLWSIFTRS